MSCSVEKSWAVALRKESVDRNLKCYFVILLAVLVALRKESVDRNISLIPLITLLIMSLSARRAWIEIFVPFNVIRPAIVALRKESVDRNLYYQDNKKHPCGGRSPQGERG